MVLNDAGRMVQSEWIRLAERFRDIRLHTFIIMPNHFHGIIEIIETPPVGSSLVGDPEFAGKDNGQPQGIAPTKPQETAPTEPQETTPTEAQEITPTNQKQLGDIIGAFKSLTTNEYIHGVKNNHWQPFDGKLWQRNYYEHIIRNEHSCQTIARYIINNPANWNQDRLFR